MADPIKASIEVEIDPTPEEVLVRVERMDGDVLLVDADGYEIAVAQRERDDARLRKLDRIEAALGDVWTADEIRWAVGDGRVVKMAYYPLDEMLRRLADALEDTDG